MPCYPRMCYGDYVCELHKLAQKQKEGRDE